MDKRVAVYLPLFLWLTAVLTTTTTTTALSTAATSSLITTTEHLDTIAGGGVAVLHHWLDNGLVQRMRKDAQDLFEQGYFVPDGLTNTALQKQQQGFSVTADRQTFRGGDGWKDTSAGDVKTRLEFDRLMIQLRQELAEGLNRPTLAPEGIRKHEMTYNWYNPGASLGRHLDEHHEETKGTKGWLLPTRRSVTWLVYLNDGWKEHEGGALRTFPRQTMSTAQVGAHDGNLQVGWIDHIHPVFLDAWRPSGMTALYQLDGDNNKKYISQTDFEVPRQPIEFARFLQKPLMGRFEQISTARLDPRLAASATNKSARTTMVASRQQQQEHRKEILPAAGTLVLFDSVTLPHLVKPVTASRPRIAATGWFHEDNQSSIVV